MDTADRLRVEKGDVVFLTDGVDGLRLRASDPGFEAQMSAARVIMRKRRNVLHALAK